MNVNIRSLLVAGLTTGLLIGVSSGSAGARQNDGGSDRSGRPSARSYINPDTGAATENPDVRPNSSCSRPDRNDRQQLSDPGTANRNVHNDACFLDRNGDKVDGAASFESSGVGFISACPDPDGAGPKTARLTDTNGDGRMDLCFQTGYQQRGIAGDLEFHARMNNTGVVGTQYVTWCSDQDADGCSDERTKQSIRIDWRSDGTAAITVPIVAIPAITLPVISTPEITLPAISVPVISVPEITLPAISAPVISVPEITLPVISVPEITVPVSTTPTTVAGA